MPHTADEARPGTPEPEDRDHTASTGQTETPSPEQHHLAMVERMETLPPERLHRARRAHRGYYRWLRLSRMALAAFIVTGAVFLIWILPWLPGGLDIEDYTPELAFTVYLLGGAAIAGMLALAFRELARRDRESLMVWATVYDEATGLHNRAYLYDRLSLECERAERAGGVFSIIVLQIRIGGSASGSPPTLSHAALQQVAEQIDRLIHRTDLVAHLSDSELAILAIGVEREHRRLLLDRLRAAVDAELPRFLDRPAVVDVKGGAVTYGVDGNDAGTLVQAARTAAILALPHRGQAA